MFPQVALFFVPRALETTVNDLGSSLREAVSSALHFFAQRNIEADKKSYYADVTHKEAYPNGQPIYITGEDLIKYRR